MIIVIDTVFCCHTIMIVTILEDNVQGFEAEPVFSHERHVNMHESLAAAS